MDMGARVSLIIYLHLWSESMALAPSIWWISLGSPKVRFFISPKIRREIFGFEKKLFENIVPFVEVALVSKFREIWWIVT
jgi:hypothetical protein